MNFKDKMSRRARYALLLHCSDMPPNEAEKAALEAAIRALDADLIGRARMHIEASQPED